MNPVAKPKIPKKYQPRGYEIMFEDRDIVVGNKSPGFVTVQAKWSRGDSVQDALDSYLQKGNSRSRNRSFAVHRLDQATSGVLIFAKTEEAQFTLKENWATNEKIYLAIVHGQLEKKSGTISSYLTEDEKYFVTSNQKMQGKFAQTEYKVVKENANFSLVEIRLLTGRKNQIRVHMADNGNPLVGDSKYGNPKTKHKNLALHARSIEFNHPYNGKRIKFEAPVPEYFGKILI